MNLLSVFPEIQDSVGESGIAWFKEQFRLIEYTWPGRIRHNVRQRTQGTTLSDCEDLGWMSQLQRKDHFSPLARNTMWQRPTKNSE